MSNPSLQIMILKRHVPLKKNSESFREMAEFMSEAGNVCLDITENKEALRNYYIHVKS